MENIEITIGPFNEEKVKEYERRANLTINFPRTDKKFLNRYLQALKNEKMLEPICANIDLNQNLTFLGLNLIGFPIKKKGEIIGK